MVRTPVLAVFAIAQILSPAPLSAQESPVETAEEAEDGENLWTLSISGGATIFSGASDQPFGEISLSRDFGEGYLELAVSQLDSRGDAALAGFVPARTRQVALSGGKSFDAISLDAYISFGKRAFDDLEFARRDGRSVMIQSDGSSFGIGGSGTYDMPIGESKFSFHPGLGVGFESYAFSENVTLAYAPGADSVSIVDLDGPVYESVDKSKLITHYVDIPLEFRFYSKENYRGFMAAVGAKVGYLFSSYTKIKYETEGEARTSKLRQDFNLNRLRYGVSARLGFRGFNLHGQYMLSDLFKSGGGPETNNFKVGLSIALF